MKQHQFAAVLLFMIVLTGIMSCKKTKHHDDPQPDAVNINIITPQPAQEYEVGDTVKMDIQITASAPLHGYELHVTRLADTTEIFTVDEDMHSQDIHVQKFFVNDGSKHSDMILEVIANIDHDGNKASKKVQFHCHAN
jgi:hypothetical protein